MIRFSIDIIFHFVFLVNIVWTVVLELWYFTFLFSEQYFSITFLNPDKITHTMVAQSIGSDVSAFIGNKPTNE